MASLLHIYLFFQVLVLAQADETCTVQENRCSCKFSNGSVINLELLSTGEHPRFAERQTVVNPLRNETFSYDPCTAFKYGVSTNPDDCQSSNNVAVCQKHGRAYWNIGDLRTATFKWNKTNWYIAYSHSERSTTVALKCTDNDVEDSQLVAFGESPSTENSSGSSKFELQLISRCACIDGCVVKNGPSAAFYAFLFLVLGIVGYFVVGMAYLKLAQGATGREMIPHYEFWSSIPAKMMDAWTYIRGGCKQETDSTYDRI